jgi:hypothetical protein
LKGVQCLLQLTEASKKSIVNTTSKDGRTPLHLAIKTWDFGTFANIKIVEALVQNEADATLKDKSGVTPAFVAGSSSFVCSYFNRYIDSWHWRQYFTCVNAMQASSESHTLSK